MSLPSCHRHPRRRRAADRGQAVPLLLALVAIAAVLMAAAGHLGARVVDRSRAQTAADAAALAGVIGGLDAAASVAAANGGTVVAYRVLDLDLVVTVRVDGEMATARATRAP